MTSLGSWKLSSRQKLASCSGEDEFNLGSEPVGVRPSVTDDIVFERENELGTSPNWTVFDPLFFFKPVEWTLATSKGPLFVLLVSIDESFPLGVVGSLLSEDAVDDIL